MTLNCYIYVNISEYNGTYNTKSDKRLLAFLYLTLKQHFLILGLSRIQ